MDDDRDGSVSVAQGLAGQIANAIMLGEFPLGSWLRQEQLAKHFGVSRQPIREALRQLEVVGIVQARPRRGVRVVGPDPSYIVDGYLIRAELEGLAAGLAATRRTQAQLGELEAEWRAFSTTISDAFYQTDSVGPKGAWVAHHDRFHELVQELSGVPRLGQLITTLNVSLPRNLSLTAVRAYDALQDNLRQHESILLGISLGSEALAREAMREHLRRSGQIIARWLTEQKQSLASR